jgi:hypothetical protein
MFENLITILFTLNVAHFLGDFTPLNRWFIAAKRYGKPWYSVAGHGAVNGVLYGIAVLLLVNWESALLAFAIETVSHTGIDIMKGRINKLFPIVEDNTRPIYWTVMGADQLLHQTVLILITSIIFI